MKPSEVRYYLHNLDGLKQEISDINADLEQYRAMQTGQFELNQVDKDPDPYKDAPESTQYLSKPANKPFSNTLIRPMGGHYNSNSQVESFVVNRVSFIEKLEKDMFKKMTILAAINGILRYLRDTEKQIIYLRYTEHLKWHIVARKIPMDRESVCRIEYKIIKEIINRYEESVVIEKAI